MKVSIITVVYNSADTIMDAVRSVRSQTYPDIEYIVVDGASTDGTTDLLRENAELFDTFVSERDEGLYDAINKGIGLATGDIVGLMHADDLFADEEVIADIVKTIREKNTDSAYGDLVYVNSDNPNQVVRKWVAGEFKREKFLYGWMPPHPTFYLKREKFEVVGPYNSSFKTAADYEFLLRCLYKNNITSAWVPRTLVRMRIGGKSNASMKTRLQANSQDFRAWEANDLKPFWFTRFMKPARKMFQFI